MGETAYRGMVSFACFNELETACKKNEDFFITQIGNMYVQNYKKNNFRECTLCSMQLWKTQVAETCMLDINDHYALMNEDIPSILEILSEQYSKIL